MYLSVGPSVPPALILTNGLCSCMPWIGSFSMISCLWVLHEGCGFSLSLYDGLKV